MSLLGRVFAGVTLAACLPFAFEKAAVQALNANREAVFKKAEAYDMVTQRLLDRNAISRETYDRRRGYWMACFDENNEYRRELATGNRQGIQIGKEVFSQACTLPDLR